MYNQEKIMPFIRAWNREPWSQKFWPLKTEWEGRFADNEIGRVRKKTFELLQSYYVEANGESAPNEDWFERLLNQYRRCEFSMRGGDSGVMNSLEWLAANEVGHEKMVNGCYYDVDKLVAEIEERRKKGKRQYRSKCLIAYQEPDDHHVLLGQGSFINGKLKPEIGTECQRSVETWGKNKTNYKNNESRNELQKRL